jgi:hypothetical protein
MIPSRKQYWIKPISSICASPRSPASQARPRQLDLRLLMPSLRPLSLVVAGQEKNSGATSVAKNAQQNLGGLELAHIHSSSSPRQHLRGILVEPELEDPASHRLPKVRRDHPRALLLKDFEHGHAHGAPFLRSQSAEPLENGFVPGSVFVELQGEWRRPHDCHHRPTESRSSRRGPACRIGNWYSSNIVSRALEVIVSSVEPLRPTRPDASSAMVV